MGYHPLGETTSYDSKSYHSANKYDRHCNMRPSQGFGVPGEKGIYFRGQGEQRPNFDGKGRTKTILGNREHKKIKT